MERPGALIQRNDDQEAADSGQKRPRGQEELTQGRRTEERAESGRTDTRTRKPGESSLGTGDPGRRKLGEEET